MDAPPKQQKPKSLRVAVTLNLLLPGAGQFYLRQRIFGSALMLAFLACFLAMIAIFMRGYVEYLQTITSGDILQSDILERLGDVFHVRWLIGLLIASIVIFAASMIGLAVASKRADSGKNL